MDSPKSPGFWDTSQYWSRNLLSPNPADDDSLTDRLLSTFTVYWVGHNPLRHILFRWSSVKSNSWCADHSSLQSFQSPSLGNSWIFGFFPTSFYRAIQLSLFSNDAPWPFPGASFSHLKSTKCFFFNWFLWAVSHLFPHLEYGGNCSCELLWGFSEMIPAWYAKQCLVHNHSRC